MAYNSAPLEIIAGSPGRIYTAALATAFPSLDTAEGSFNAAWKKLGTSGDLHYDAGGGVSIEHPQSISLFRPLSERGAVKAFRVEEGCRIKVKVIDLTLENWAKALNGNGHTVSDTAAGVGTAGYRKVGLARGPLVNEQALLIRLLVSPYGTDWIGQLEIPRCVVVGSPSVVFQKGEPAGLEFEFEALVDTSAASADEKLGRIIFQDAAAS